MPVAGQLAQLPDLQRCEPRLWQPAHPQQVGQVRGVTLIVFDPAVGERLDSQRMGQVHLRARFLEHVRGPVPAVRGLDHHPRVLSGLGDLTPQRRRAVGDPHGLQLPAVLGHPHQHASPGAGPSRRPAGRHMLPSSWASLAWWRRMLCNFQHPPGAEARSFIASRKAVLDTFPPADRSAAVSPMGGNGGATRTAAGYRVAVSAGAARYHSARVMRPVKMYMTVLVVAVP